MVPSSYDVMGNIVLLKFSDDVKKSEKVKTAKEVLKRYKKVKSVLEKKEKVKGRLRTIKTEFLAGEKNLEADYVENGCRFKFNVESCYFSSRLSNERKEIALEAKKGERVLVMFGGVGVYGIVIAKNSRVDKVVSVEIGRECSKYAKENVRLNKLSNVEVVQGDVKKVLPKLGDKFDRVVMPRPNLKDSFLESAFSVIKKGGVIYYYGFDKEYENVLKRIKEDSLKAGRWIKILKVKKAGDIAPYKFRWRVDFKVLN